MQSWPASDWTPAYREWLAKRATELGPGHASTWWTYANLLLHSNRCDEALRMMARAKALLPRDPKLHNDHGAMLARCEQWEDAVAAFTESIRLTSSPTNGLRHLRRDAFAARSNALGKLHRDSEAYHDLLASGWIPPRGTNQLDNPIDLSPFYNASTFELAIEYQLVEISLGAYQLDGSGFDVRGCVRLAGSQSEKGFAPYPIKVVDIPVNKRCRSLHLLHAAMQAAVDGTEVGHYTIHYADDREEQVPIRYGEHLRAFTTSLDPEHRAGAGKEVWANTDRPNRDSSGNMRFFKTTWNNPRAGVGVRSLDFVSARTPCELFLVAVTVEP